MKHVLSNLAVVMLCLGAASGRAWGASDAALSGVVRDLHGTPQMGALVELLSADATVVAQAFTDDHGRYAVASVLPGLYQLRVSAAFLLPMVRQNVRLRTGTHAIADLTMTAIFEAGAWLPAQRRNAGAPADDWQWTLHSTANRPLLRLAGNSGQGPSGESSSSTDHRQTGISEGQVTVLAGDGSFGEGGTHQVLIMDHTAVDGEISVLRAKVQDNKTSGTGTGFVLAAGVERERPLGGGTRLFFSAESHPELETTAGNGLQLLRVATTDKVILGDAFVVDAGTLFTAERLLGTKFDSAPYLRVAFRPSPGLAIEYRLATNRTLQQTEDLDDVALPEEGLSGTHGEPVLRKAFHQEVAVTDATPGHTIGVAVYRDSLPVVAVQGGGLTRDGNLHDLAAITDPETGTFRLTEAGLTSSGLRVTWNQVLSPVISACFEAQFGHALEVEETATQLQDLPAYLHAKASGAVSGAVQLKTRRTGTTVNARYRWQPERTLTQVDEFDVSPNDAYLSVSLRQRLWSGRRLKGVSAVAEATNLLAQGYEPLLSPDGHTLYLAQVPRGILGGLAFSF